MVAVLLGLYWVFISSLPSLKNRFVLGVFACSVLLAALASAFIYDAVAWDGITYHSEATLGLLHGINPIYSAFDGNFPLWTNHYPKTMWYFAAALGRRISSIRDGKVLQFLSHLCLWHL